MENNYAYTHYIDRTLFKISNEEDTFLAILVERGPFFEIFHYVQADEKTIDRAVRDPQALINLFSSPAHPHFRVSQRWPNDLNDILLTIKPLPATRIPEEWQVALTRVAREL